nr:hypothetical protein [Tanacetum cinerariifolium]
MFTDSTTMVDNEPLNGSNEDITNPYECEQTLNFSACSLNLSAGIIFKCKQMIKWTAMASVDNTLGLVPQIKESSLEPALHEMTTATISSRLVPNPPPSTLYETPSKKKPTKAKKDVPYKKKPSFKPKPTKNKAPVKADKGKGLNVLSEVALSEAAQRKKATKRSKKDFYIYQASGSGDGTDFESRVPDEQQRKISCADEGI